MEFKTIKETGRVEEEIKKSRFICHVKQVETEEEARDFINSIKKEHYKATHNCSAFILGEKSEIKRTSDDGEPSGTAGIPMLGVLESHQLTNLCVVVTRYFGGIKLGAGGLIRAYAGCVALAVKEIGLVEIKEQVGLRLQLSYSQYQEYANFLKSENLMEFDTEFTDSVATTIFVNKEDQNRIEKGLIEFFNGKVQLSNQGIRQVEVPIIS
ncbi:YigZ family protein [Streptococcus gordonii]|uniref:YigZ family protein n=1 Tax=Streptococcus gordonii TaxID=1302 RepID=UPI001CBC4BD1|nr:YigZ family protein [Streptococcus gordonii]MBZ2116218.1 YigZ family protein [Streptococcus gordonii]